MNRPRSWSAALVPFFASVAGANDGTATWMDPRWDASARRTDSANNGTLNADARLPDLLRITLSAWESPTASTDPYNGSAVADPGQAHLFRLDIVFDGPVGPPGELGDGSAIPYNPFQFSGSPVFGFIEMDMDRDRDSGGELGGAARSRYVANVARFGKLPEGSLAERAAVWGTDLDEPFGHVPNYRASGTDFLLSLCGCFDPMIVSEGGNGNLRFDAGETWVVRGPFLQRAGGYREASLCYGGTSGIPGLYDPTVNLRFRHSTVTDQTTISLVFALDTVGAGQLAGQPPLPVNYDVGDQASMLEAVQDLIDGANTLPLSGPVWALVRDWQGRTATDVLDPTRWRLTALVGTASSTLVDSPYIWTDTGFDDVLGDLNHDGAANSVDRAFLRQQIILLDAGPLDAEGPMLDNGQVQIIGFGSNFCLYDITGDGFINDQDLNWYCTADFNGDGRLTVLDYTAFLNAFAARDPRADLNHSGSFEVTDIILFGNAFAAGCS